MGKATLARKAKVKVKVKVKKKGKFETSKREPEKCHIGCLIGHTQLECWKLLASLNQTTYKLGSSTDGKSKKCQKVSEDITALVQQ